MAAGVVLAASTSLSAGACVGNVRRLPISKGKGGRSPSSHGGICLSKLHIPNYSPRSPTPLWVNGRRDMLIHVPCRSIEGRGRGQEVEGDESRPPPYALLQAVLWGVEATYIIWLFLLPYAPGDPVWAISPATVDQLLGLSLNFFYILPFLNFVGIHAMEAPVFHPVSEGLFNFVIGWTLLFAPLLFTDSRRDRYRGSLEVLWGLQMFLTNVFLIPYMAIRLSDVDVERTPPKQSQFSQLMTNGARAVAAVGSVVCIVSAFWFLYGRGGTQIYGGLTDRWDFFKDYIGSERLAYAFIWDIVLYSIFQPWLVGDNLQNTKEKAVGVVNVLRFVPVVGLVAYLLSLDKEKEP